MLPLDTSAILSMNVNNKVNELKNLDANDKALKQKTDEFEAIFLKILLDEAIKREDPLYPKEAGKDIYNSMYNDMLSKELAGGFGFSELLFNYLKDRKLA